MKPREWWEAWLELRHHQAPKIHRVRPEGTLDEAFIHVIEKSAYDELRVALEQIANTGNASCDKIYLLQHIEAVRKVASEALKRHVGGSDT